MKTINSWFLLAGFLAVAACDTQTNDPRSTVGQQGAALNAPTVATTYEFPLNGTVTAIDTGEANRYQTATEAITEFLSTKAVRAWSLPTAPQMNVGWPAMMAEHDKMAHDYLVRVGIPESELGQVYHFHGHAYESYAAHPDQAPTPTGDLGFSTTYGRVYGGYVVLDSHAGVQLNANGVPVSLGIEWPDVPSSVLQQANALQATLSGGWKPSDALLAGRTLVGTQVVIRHAFAGGGAANGLRWSAVLRTESISFDGMHTYSDTDANENPIAVVDTSKAQPSVKK